MKLENARLNRREFDGDGVIMLVSLNTLACSLRLLEWAGGLGGVYSEVDRLVD